MDDSRCPSCRVGTIIGGVFVLLGIIAFVHSGFTSVTALFPLLLGLPLALLGFIGERSLPVIYGIGLIGLVAIGGSLRVVGDMLRWDSGTQVDIGITVASQISMILLGIVVLVFVGWDIVRGSISQ